MWGKGARKISRDKRGRASKAMWIFSEGEGSIFDVFGNPNIEIDVMLEDFNILQVGPIISIKQNIF